MPLSLPTLTPDGTNVTNQAIGAGEAYLSLTAQAVLARIAIRRYGLARASLIIAIGNGIGWGLQIPISLRQAYEGRLVTDLRTFPLGDTSVGTGPLVIASILFWLDVADYINEIVLAGLPTYAQQNIPVAEFAPQPYTPPAEWIARRYQGRGGRFLSNAQVEQLFSRASHVLEEDPSITRNSLAQWESYNASRIRVNRIVPRYSGFISAQPVAPALSRIFDVFGTSVRVYRNPSADTIRAITFESGLPAAKALRFRGNLYVWANRSAMHADIASALGLIEAGSQLESLFVIPTLENGVVVSKFLKLDEILTASELAALDARAQELARLRSAARAAQATAQVATPGNVIAGTEQGVSALTESIRTFLANIATNANERAVRELTTRGVTFSNIERLAFERIIAAAVIEEFVNSVNTQILALLRSNVPYGSRIVSSTGATLRFLGPTFVGLQISSELEQGSASLAEVQRGIQSNQILRQMEPRLNGFYVAIRIAQVNGWPLPLTASAAKETIQREIGRLAWGGVNWARLHAIGADPGIEQRLNLLRRATDAFSPHLESNLQLRLEALQALGLAAPTPTPPIVLPSIPASPQGRRQTIDEIVAQDNLEYAVLRELARQNVNMVLSPGNLSSRISETVTGPLSHVTNLNQPGEESGEMAFYKFTMGFNTIQGGFSESVYSTADIPLATAQQAANQILNARSQLSITSALLACLNPIIPTFKRLSNPFANRQSYNQSLLSSDVTQSYGGLGASSNANNNQNLDLELGPRITYYGGNGGQAATVVHHGFPAFAGQQQNQNPPVGQIAYSLLREIIPTGTWTTALTNYLTTLRTAGFGFRRLLGAWNNQTTDQPGPYAKPDFWTYNSGTQQVQLEWLGPATGGGSPPNVARAFPAWPSSAYALAQLPPGWPQNGGSFPGIGTKVRVQVRGWKGFQVANGRWAAQVVPPQNSSVIASNGWALAIQLPVRQPTVGAAILPFVSPLCWEAWYPGQNIAGTGNAPVGSPAFLAQCYSFDFIESKKLGRNFEQQRGRARNRAR